MRKCHHALGAGHRAFRFVLPYKYNTATISIKPHIPIAGDLSPSERPQWVLVIIIHGTPLKSVYGEKPSFLRIRDD